MGSHTFYICMNVYITFLGEISDSQDGVYKNDFWGDTPCNLIEDYWRFRCANCLHQQDVSHIYLFIIVVRTILYCEFSVECYCKLTLPLYVEWKAKQSRRMGETLESNKNIRQVFYGGCLKSIRGFELT